jgi:hypothetical protein
MALYGRSDLTLHKNDGTLEVGANYGTLKEAGLTSDDLTDVFRKAAEKAVAEWFSGQWDRQVQEVDDLVQNLWAWYLEAPATQKAFADMPDFGIQKVCFKQCLTILSGKALESDVFEGKALYSSEAVKDALKGQSTNKYLHTVIPAAMGEINEGYAEAIRSRYEDGVAPPQGKEHVQLVRAIKALTAEINVEYITSEIEDIGSRTVVFADTRRPKGGHGDPTGDIALMLVADPALRPDYLEVTPISDVVAGQGATPSYDLGNGVMFRPSGSGADLLRRHPELLGPYLDMKREALCTT